MNKTLGIPSPPDKPKREAMMDCLKSKALAKRLEKRTGCVLGIEPNEHQIPPFSEEIQLSHTSARKP